MGLGMLSCTTARLIRINADTVAQGDVQSPEDEVCACPLRCIDEHREGKIGRCMKREHTVSKR